MTKGTRTALIEPETSGSLYVCRLTRGVFVVELCGTAGRTQGVGNIIAAVLGMLASLLDVRLSFLRTAFGLEILVVRLVADGCLCLTGKLFGLVLCLVC